MNEFEQLAVLTALESAVTEKKKELREVIDDEMRNAYETTGSDRVSLRVNGEKVGSVSVIESKPGFRVDSMAELEEFALDYDLAHIERRIAPDMVDSVIAAMRNMFGNKVINEAVEERVVMNDGWEKRLRNVGGEAVLEDSGLIVPGVSYVPAQYKSTRVTGCKPADVLPKALASGEVYALLEGGER